MTIEIHPVTPTIGAVTGCFCSTQASATCAIFTPRAAATFATALLIASLASSVVV